MKETNQDAPLQSQIRLSVTMLMTIGAQCNLPSAEETLSQAIDARNVHVPRGQSGEGFLLYAVVINASGIGIRSMRFTNVSGNGSVVLLFPPHQQVVASIPPSRLTNHNATSLHSAPS